MAEFALFINDAFQEIRNYPERPENIAHKGVAWYPVERIMGPWAYTTLGGDKYVICTVDPATLPPPVPESITPRQCRLILSQQGLLSSVEAMIAQSTDDVRITWEYALEFKRNDPLLIQLGTNLGLAPEQIDQFFIAAAQL